MVESESGKNNVGGSLFKKKKFKKTKTRGRIRRRLQDSSDDEKKPGEQQDGDASGHEPDSALEAIISAKKKRRLLESALGKNRRGIDSSLLLQPSVKASVASEEAEADSTSNKVLSKRLQGNFSGGTGGDTADGSGDGVLQRKHKEAMEDFIRQNLALEKAETNAPVQETSDGTDMEAKLYADLASTAVKLSGKTTTDDTLQQKVKEGDVGAGGAMLGGTGIAEVELPVEERIKTARATEEAAAARELARQRQVPRNEPRQEPAHGVFNPEQMLPVNFGVGMGRRPKKEQSVMANTVPLALDTSPSTTDKQSSASISDGPTASSAGADVLRSDVSGLGSSFSHNFRMHTHEWITQKKQERESELELERQEESKEEGPVANQERMGFEAARRAARGEAPLPSTGPAGSTAFSGSGGERQSRDYQQRSSDDRAWKTFVKRTRGR